MNAPALPNADRLSAALTAYREIATDTHNLAAPAGTFGPNGVYMETRLDNAAWRKAARSILDEWNDSNDPPEIHTNLDGWHGEIQSQGFRIALTHGNDMARLGLYRGAHDGAHGDALGEPIVLEEI